MSGTSKALVFNLGKKKTIMGGEKMKRPKITNKTDENVPEWMMCAGNPCKPIRHCVIRSS